MEIQLPAELENLIHYFNKLPGIGEKTAQRLVLSVMKWNGGELDGFATALSQIQGLQKCELCGTFCSEDRCGICMNEKRKAKNTICVVEEFTDFLAIEKSKVFQGTYHLLGGVINPLMGVGPEDLGLDRLEKRIQDEDIEELILALNPSVEGDVTCAYIRQEFGDLTSIGRIGFGVPMGSSLEYMDPLTISKAMEFRRTL